jgi:predicted amidohydrolase
VPALAKDIDIPRDFLYWHHMTNRAVRVGDWKLVSAGTRRDDGPWELYDLKSDRSEMHNLAEKHPDKVKQLAELWQKREEEFRRQAGPAGPDQDAERVRNGNFTAIGKDRLPEGWSLWKPFWDRAACRVRVVGKEGGQAGRDGQVGNLPHAKTAENLPPDARGVAVDSPHEPFAVGGLRQDLTGIEGGQAYAIVAICAAKDITSPSQSLLVRMEWTKAGKGLHPAGMLVRGPRLDDGKLKFNDILIAPKEADGARLSLEVKWPQGGAVVWERVGVTPAAPPAPRKAKVGTVYLRPRNSTPERNLQLFSNEIDAAGRLGLDIVCLPEAITSAGTQQNGPQSAEPIPGPSTERLGNAARKNRLWVVAGLYERDGDRVYNTAVLLDREGRLAGKYRKIHLPREEWQLGVTPGHEYPVFQTDFGTIAMEICYDIFFPETTAAFSLRGAEVIFVPIWGNTLPDAAGRAEGESIFRVRARDHGVFLVPSVYDGNSLVVDPLGRILASSKGAQGVFWHEIDLGQRECLDWIGHWRSIGPRDRMPASYGPLVEPHKSTGIHATSATAP